MQLLLKQAESWPCSLFHTGLIYSSTFWCNHPFPNFLPSCSSRANNPCHLLIHSQLPIHRGPGPLDRNWVHHIFLGIKLLLITQSFKILIQTNFTFWIKLKGINSGVNGNRDWTYSCKSFLKLIFVCFDVYVTSYCCTNCFLIEMTLFFLKTKYLLPQ